MNRRMRQWLFLGALGVGYGAAFRAGGMPQLGGSVESLDEVARRLRAAGYEVSKFMNGVEVAVPLRWRVGEGRGGKIDDAAAQDQPGAARVMRRVRSIVGEGYGVVWSPTGVHERVGGRETDRIIFFISIFPDD